MHGGVNNCPPAVISTGTTSQNATITIPSQGTGVMITEDAPENYTVMVPVQEQTSRGTITRMVPQTQTRTVQVTREATSVEVVELKVDKLLDHFNIQFP